MIDLAASGISAYKCNTFYDRLLFPKKSIGRSERRQIPIIVIVKINNETMHDLKTTLQFARFGDFGMQFQVESTNRPAPAQTYVISIMNHDSNLDFVYR